MMNSPDSKIHRHNDPGREKMPSGYFIFNMYDYYKSQMRSVQSIIEKIMPRHAHRCPLKCAGFATIIPLSLQFFPGIIV
jgi:hypothetical protein